MQVGSAVAAVRPATLPPHPNMLASLRRRALLALAALTLAACGDVTELPTDFATVEFAEYLALTNAAFDTPQANALVELGVYMDDALVTAGAGASLASVLGRTFEWDVADGRYERTARPGAPEDGVRFILYGLDATARLPAEPLVEVGTLTITSGGTVNAPTATVTLRDRAGTTVFAYAASRGGTASAPTFNAVGSAGVGPDAATFSLTVGFNAVSRAITAEWRSEIASRSLTSRTTLGLNANTGAIALRGLMQRGLRRVEIGGTFHREFGGQLTAKVGEKPFARIALAGEDDIAITTVDGQRLPAEEEATLRLIFKWFADALTWYDALLLPAYAALGVS
jgi:hypothetical protein